MAGYVGNIPVPQGTQTRQSFTATASQTSFPTIGYTAGFIDVYLNGIKLVSGTDFTASNGSDVVLTTGAAVNDVLDVVIFDTFDTSSGTFSATTLKNNVTLKNDTEQDTDGGRASKIIYQGEQSGGEISTLAEIQASHDGTADDEKGDLIFRTNDGSDGTSPTEAMRITSQQRVGIGDVDPISPLHISSGNSGASASVHSDELFVEGSGNSGITIASGTSGYGNVRFADSGGTDQGIVQYYHGDDRLMIFTDGTKRLSIDSDGVKFGTDTAAANALDDYETGSFQMTMTGISTTNPVGYGIYVKVGNLCHFSWYSGTVSVTSAVVPVLGGLPFTSISPYGAGGAYPAVTFAHNTYATNVASGYINIGTTNIYLTANNSSGGASVTTGSKYVMCSGTYYVA